MSIGSLRNKLPLHLECLRLASRHYLPSARTGPGTRFLRRRSRFAKPSPLWLDRTALLFKTLQNDALWKSSELALKTVALIGDPQALPVLQSVRSHWQETLTGKAREYLLPIIEKTIAQLANDPLTLSTATTTS